MYGDDPRDLGLGPPEADDPDAARPKFDEEDDWDNTRPRSLLGEDLYEE